VTKACVISGAASGIGEATLWRFFSNGYACLGIDTDEAAIDRMLGGLDPAARERVRLIKADLVAEDTVDLSALDALVGDSAELTLVNNLGGSRADSEESLEPGTWDGFAEVLAFNLKPLHTLTRACLGVMRENGYGRIVNVSSISARRPIGVVDYAYAAAKGAVLALSRQLSMELAGEGILVNTVCPGIIATERIEQRWANRSEQVTRSMLAEIPLRRLGRPEEVANVVYFVGSTSTYTTGSILDVNGGMYMP
jgi:3-oxoacyl-[acyl-carrier protein] reductase